MDRRTHGIRWDRLGRWALIGVFALVAYLYVGPALNWISTYKEAARQREQVAQLRAEHEKLLARKAELTAPGALEREARRLGMVKAGERAYIVKGLPK
jgi:cell division protein FtsB